MSIHISEDPSESQAFIYDALGGPPTLTLTIEGLPRSGKSSVAGVAKNSINKNLIMNGVFKADARILIRVVALKEPDMASATGVPPALSSDQSVASSL